MEPAAGKDRERKKAAAELLVLSLLKERRRHGYEIAKLIEARSEGTVVFHVASLYTLLGRLERRGLIEGRWIEKAGQRRRRFYGLTAAGRRSLGEQRRQWVEFVQALDRIAGLDRA